MHNSPAAERPRVVVTGIGAVTPAGWGVARFAEALLSARTAIVPFSRFDHSGQRTHIAGQVPPPPSAVNAAIGGSQLSNSDKFAVSSALEACERARLPCPLRGIEAGVFFASSTGGLFETEIFARSMLTAGTAVASRRLLASYSLSSPGEAIARRLEIGGPTETVSSACAASALAIEQGLRAIQRGEVDLVIVGGADCLCVTTYSGFNSLRAIDDAPCRPFRRDRSGLSLGEGAAALVLESLAHARARGARPIAELLGAASSCDAAHMTAPDPDGTWAAQAMRRAIADAGIVAADIDFLNAHGTATPLNDAAESAALRQVFGERTGAIPVEATKGVVGHLLGAAGAVEAVATIVSLEASVVHPAPADGTIDEALGIDVVVGRPRTALEPRTAMSANLGFGGANAAVVFRRWSES